MTPFLNGFADELVKEAGVLSALKKIPVPGAVKHLGSAAVDIAPWLAVGYLLGRRGKKGSAKASGSSDAERLERGTEEE